MAKAKVGKIKWDTINGVLLTEPFKTDIFFENKFFVYTPEYLVAMIKPEDRDHRWEGSKAADKRAVPILIGDSPKNVEHKLWSYLDFYHQNTYKEEKIIHYEIRFNSNKTPNNNQNISFANTPAMSMKWGIHYLVTFADGRQSVISHPYKSYGNLVSSKFDYTLEKYNSKYKWIPWTEEREQFFINTEKAMEDLISKVNNFFNQEPGLLAAAVDNLPKLIG